MSFGFYGVTIAGKHLHVCNMCGAVVQNPATHGSWHDRQSSAPSAPAAETDDRPRALDRELAGFNFDRDRARGLVWKMQADLDFTPAEYDQGDTLVVDVDELMDLLRIASAGLNACHGPTHEMGEGSAEPTPTTGSGAPDTLPPGRNERTQAEDRGTSPSPSPSDAGADLLTPFGECFGREGHVYRTGTPGETCLHCGHLSAVDVAHAGVAEPSPTQR